MLRHKIKKLVYNKLQIKKNFEVHFAKLKVSQWIVFCICDTDKTNHSWIIWQLSDCKKVLLLNDYLEYIWVNYFNKTQYVEFNFSYFIIFIKSYNS